MVGKICTKSEEFLKGYLTASLEGAFAAARSLKEGLESMRRVDIPQSWVDEHNGAQLPLTLEKDRKEWFTEIVRETLEDLKIFCPSINYKFHLCEHNTSKHRIIIEVQLIRPRRMTKEELGYKIEIIQE